MNKSKQCPKCESPYIGEFPYVSVGIGNLDESVTMSGLPLRLYTCGDCGYCETYLRTPVREWTKTPQEHEHMFTWHREPPTPEGPYR